MTPTQAPHAESRSSLIAALSFACGLVALLMAVLFVFSPIGGMGMLIFSSLVALAAVVLGIVALVRRQRRWMAVTGLVLGIVTAVAWIGLLVFTLLFIGAFTNPM